MGKKKAAPEAESAADDKTNAPNDDKSKSEAPKTPEPETPATGDDNAPEPDFDDIELQEAKKALEEEAGEGKDEETPPEGDTKPEGDAPKPDPEPEPDPAPDAADKGGKEPAKDADPDETKMVPLPRLNTEIEKKEKAIQEAAYWRGVAETSLQTAKNQAVPPAGHQPTEKSPDEIITEARGQQTELAKKLDDGEITTEQWQTENAKLDDAIYAAREANMLAKIPGPTAPQTVTPAGDSLTLDQMTVKLEEDHPIVHELVEDDWAIVELRARQELAAEGVQLTPDARQPDDRIEYRFRQKKAEVAEALGPTLIKARGGEPPANKQPDNTQKPATPEGGLSPKAAARDAKLSAAAAAPPDTSNLGSSGSAETITDEAIEKMTDEQIAELPESVRRRIMPQ